MLHQQQERIELVVRQHEEMEQEEMAWQEQKMRSERLARGEIASGCDHDHQHEREIYLLPNEEKFQRCNAFKIQGRRYFDEGQFWRACERYRKVVVYLDYTFANDDHETAIIQDLTVTCTSNMALCKIKTGEYKEAVNHASHVLSIDATNKKALFLLAKAKRLQGEFMQAQDLLKQAMKLQSISASYQTEIHKEWQLVQSEMRYNLYQLKLFSIKAVGAASKPTSNPGPTDTTHAKYDKYGKVQAIARE